MSDLPLGGATAGRFPFPQILPFRHDTSGKALGVVMLIRSIFCAAFLFYLLAVIFPGSDIPLIQKISTYLYLGFAVTMTVIYQSHNNPYRAITNVGHFIGFTLFIVGNAAYSLWASHNPMRAFFWIIWLSDILVECAIVDGAVHPLSPISSLREYWARIRAGKVAAAIREAAQRQRINDELAATKLQLERVNRSLTMSALAASIAHEVSQPLASVVVNADAARRWFSKNDIDEARNALGRVVEDGHRASAVIANFRRMLHEDENPRTSLDISLLVEEALGILAADIYKNDVHVRKHSLQDVPPILGDWTSLRQVFLNLIANAIEAMDGVLDRPHLLIIRCEEVSGGRAVISIEDSGCGIKNPDPVFDAFYTTKTKGMGVGLFISRLIVEAHNGTIDIKSQPGRTKFYVSLPLEGGQD